MTIRLAISGFGRIGRMTLRAFEMQRNDMEVVLINSPGPVETSAHLYEFDSVHGRAAAQVNYGDDWMDIGRWQNPYEFSSNRNSKYSTCQTWRRYCAGMFGQV